MGSAIVLVLSVFLAEAAGGIGSIATRKAIPNWYVRIRKPTWNPPNWVFLPVWTTLYLLMGNAAWIVWRTVGFEDSLLWLWLYLIQLVLNVVWSFLFFGLHRPDVAFAEVLALWASILATLLVFWSISPLAGALLIPYLLWVTFASALNGAIWRLNPTAGPGASAQSGDRA